MPIDHKQNEISPEEIEKKRKSIIDRFKRKSYWTFKEGIDLLLPFEYRGNFPLYFAISDSLFDDIKRDVEVGKLETINTGDEITQIVNYDAYAEWKKICKENSWDKSRENLSIREAETDKQNYFYEKIKLKPENFLKYVKDNFERFSDIEIPPELLNIEGKDIQEEIKITNLEEFDTFLNNLRPELDNLFKETNDILKKSSLTIKQATQDKITDSCLKAYEKIDKTKKFKLIKNNDIDGSRISDNTEHLPRELKGQIIFNLIKRIDENYFNYQDIPQNYQSMYARYTSISKNTSKE